MHRLLLLALLGCGKSDAERHHELTICIAASTDEARRTVDAYRVGSCLRNRFTWNAQDVQDAEVQISLIQRQMRDRAKVVP